MSEAESPDRVVGAGLSGTAAVWLIANLLSVTGHVPVCAGAAAADGQMYECSAAPVLDAQMKKKTQGRACRRKTRHALSCVISFHLINPMIAWKLSFGNLAESETFPIVKYDGNESFLQKMCSKQER